MSTVAQLVRLTGSKLRSLITAPVRIFKNASFRQRISYGSAAALVLLFTPAVAVSLNQDEPVETHNNVQTTVTLPSELPETEVKAETTQGSSTSSASTSITNNNGQVSVKVNGQEVPVPKNGTVQHDGTTITTQTNSTGGNSTTFTTTHNHSNSVTTVNGNTTVQHNSVFNSQ